LAGLDQELSAQGNRQKALLDDVMSSPTDLADARGLVAALQVKRTAFVGTKANVTGPLQSALQASRHEFSILHQAERERRITGNLELLRSHLDPAAIGERLNIWGDWESLAECFSNIVTLDGAVGYRSGRYGWSDRVDLTAAAQVEDRFLSLETEIARLNATPKKATANAPQKR
jgi:hypothetical protein